MGYNSQGIPINPNDPNPIHLPLLPCTYYFLYAIKYDTTMYVFLLKLYLKTSSKHDRKLRPKVVYNFIYKDGIFNIFTSIIKNLKI